MTLLLSPLDCFLCFIFESLKAKTSSDTCAKLPETLNSTSICSMLTVRSSVCRSIPNDVKDAYDTFNDFFLLNAVQDLGDDFCVSETVNNDELTDQPTNENGLLASRLKTVCTQDLYLNFVADMMRYRLSISADKQKSIMFDKAWR